MYSLCALTELLVIKLYGESGQTTQ